MPVTARTGKAELVGHEKPRLAPPTPARSKVAELVETAKSIGIELRPWQTIVGRYLYAVGPEDRWLYPEVAAVVSRQNGKSEIIVPHVMRRLAMGRRILHAAQHRDLPRLVWLRVARLVEAKYPFDAIVRRGAGQETIEVPSTGGMYRITAATGSGPRGMSVDDLIADELRELEEEFIGAALPTLAASSDPQVFYLSNAGEEGSKALNAVRLRADEDPSLAYLEWSASPELAADDRNGWVQANPSIGHAPALLKFVERAYQSHKLAGTMARFETEHLCRWVSTMREQLVDAYSWTRCQQPVGKPVRPALAVAMDPKGQRASIAMAWQEADGVALRLLSNVTGSPVDTDAIGNEVKQLASRHGIKLIGYDPLTDAELVKYVKKAEPISGQKYANASAQFVNIVNAGKLRHQDCDPVTDDLTWTSRKPDGDAGSYHAVRAVDDRPITASLAAIRAVWLASGPTPATPRVM